MANVVKDSDRQRNNDECGCQSTLFARGADDLLKACRCEERNEWHERDRISLLLVR